MVSLFVIFRRDGLSRITSAAGMLLILAFTLTGARFSGVLYKYPFYDEGYEQK